MDSFSKYHPAVNFIYFLSVIGFSMFLMHPVFLIISFFSSITYCIYLKGLKFIKLNFLFLLPTFLVVCIMNIAFNHQGSTILVYINDNPITSESIIYAVAFSLMFVSMIVWFLCYNHIVTSDKIVYIFGKTIPSLSLVFSMIMRFVPKFSYQIKQISNAQKCIGKNSDEGNIIKRIKNGANVLSILVTWSLENAIETADSMKSRGYGLPSRTSFSNYKLRKNDVVTLVLIILFSIFIITSLFFGYSKALYFPVIHFKSTGFFSVIIFVFYAFLLNIPLIINVTEDIKWKFIKSKI